MKRATLRNGLKVLYQEKKGNMVIIQVLVNVGSNDENPEEYGISHFLEHVLFEGTAKRPTNLDISNEIEKIGGDFNAYTTNERTCFYIKVLKKHFIKAVDVLADMMQNSIFKEEHVNKEKNIVLKEIDMVHDEPSFYQWILLQKNVFAEHPAKQPTYGNRKVIENLSREKVLKFYKNYYSPKNMMVSIVGEVNNWKDEIEKKFTFNGGKKYVRPSFYEPNQKKIKIKKEKRDIANTRVAVAFKTVPRNNKDSVVLEIINGILGRGQSGRLFSEIRTKRGLAYEVGTHHISEGTFGYFAAYASIDKKNVSIIKKLILKEFKKLETINEKDLSESKTYIEGDFLLELEDAQKHADQLLFWEQLGGAHKMREFLPAVKKVTASDVKRVVKRYFKNPTIIILEGR